MAEIWGAAIAAGGALLSGVAASKKAKQDAKNAKENTREMTENDARYSAILSQFNAEQEDYYKQLDRQRKQRGLEQFKQFSTMSQFAPGAATSGNTIVVPNKPNISELIAANVPQEQRANSDKKKSNSGLITALTGDPILGKLFG